MSSLLLSSLRRCCSATGIPAAFLRASSTTTTTTTTNSSNNTRYPRPESHKPAGTEEWNFKLPVSGSGGNTYMWPANNLRVHPPLDEMPGDSEAARAGEAGEKTPEEAKPAYVCHIRAHIKYSPKKMRLVASLVRGMSVGEAKRQLQFAEKSAKGARAAREVLEEAQDIAVKEHGVEFRTNLWVAESFAVQSQTVKGVRRHARGRMGEITYRYVNYYVRLEEGAPPPVYREEDTLNEIDPRRSLEEYIRGHRAKHVPYHTEKDPNYY